MSFPWSINYFFSTALNASNTITSAVFQPVTFLVNGNTELKSDTVINHLGIKKIPNASYSLDVSGNVNISGSISGGGAHTWTGKQTFTGGIDASSSQVINFGTNAVAMSGAGITAGSIGQTQISGGYVDLTNAQTAIAGAKTFTTLPLCTDVTVPIGNNLIRKTYADATYGLLGSTNTWGSTQTFSVPPVLTNKVTLQTASVYGSNYFSYTVGWGNDENIILTPTAASSGILDVQLPSIATANIGTSFNILQGGAGISTSNYLRIRNYNSTAGMFYNGGFSTYIYIDMGRGIHLTSHFGYRFTAMSTGQIWVVQPIAFNPNSITNSVNTFSAKQTFTGDIDASGTQTINFGTNAPTMSGANIGSTTIPNSALQSTVTLNNTASTFSAKKTFTGGIDASGTQTILFGANAPTMSGANIGSATIPYASLATDSRLNTIKNSYSFYSGNGAFNALSTGDLNTAYGYSCGSYITTGTSNSFFGVSAGNRCNTSSVSNTAIGDGAMGTTAFNGSSIESNTACGANALGAIVSGNRNSGYGRNSLNALTSGSNNCFSGHSSGVNTVTGNNNTGIGYNCHYTTPAYDSSNCTFLGASTNLSASVNNVTCVGYGTTCGVASTIQLGSNSEVVAFSGNLKSGSNTITTTQLGYLSGVSGGIVDTSSNQTIGGTKTFSTLPVSSVSSTTGGTQFLTRSLNDARYGQLGTINTWSLVQTFSSVPVLSGAGILGSTIKTGLYGSVNESAIKDLYIDTTLANCALGNDSMISITTGVGNCALSTRALKYCTSGSNNMGIGTQALSSLTTGIENVGISTGAIQSYNGSYSVGIGAYSGYGLLSGDTNVLIGYYAGGVTTTSASSTVCIGNNAGTGSATLNSCVFIGNATCSTGTKSNVIVIGAGNATASNDCIIGDSNNNVKIAGTLAVTGTINSVSSTVFGYISGLTSSAQTQINNILNGTTAFTGFNYNSVYTPYSVGSITAGGTWTSSPLAGTYLWSASATASTNTTITLPSITTAMIGVSIRFRRIANASSTNALLVLPNTTGSNVIYPLGSVTTQTTSATIIFAFNTSTFGQNGYSGTLVCVNSTTWAIM